MATKQADKVKSLKILGPISEAAGILAGIAVIGGKKICENIASAAKGQKSKPATKSSRTVAKKKKKQAAPKKAAKSSKTKKSKQTKQKKKAGSPKSKVAKKKSTQANTGIKKNTSPKEQRKRQAVQKKSVQKEVGTRGISEPSKPQSQLTSEMNTKANVSLSKPGPQPRVVQAKPHSAAYAQNSTPTDSVPKVPGASLPYNEQGL